MTELPSDDSHHIINNLVDFVNRKIDENNEVLTTLNDLTLISRVLVAMRDLGRQKLLPLKEQGVLTFDYHPPIEIPVYEVGSTMRGSDEEYLQALWLIGSHAGQHLRVSRQGIATQAELEANTLAGAELFQPAVEGISEVGFILFNVLQKFDGIGAVLQGRSIDNVRAIDLSAIGPSFHLVILKEERTEQKQQIITLRDIDEWRRSRLTAAVNAAKESGLQRETIVGMIEGVELDSIF